MLGSRDSEVGCRNIGNPGFAFTRRWARCFGDALLLGTSILQEHRPPFMKILSYRDLDVWNVAMQLAEQCYAQTRRFPLDEKYGMAIQVRRSASSIPANIAEGHGRAQLKGYLYHLTIARGSLNELHTLLLLALRLGYLKESDFVETRKTLDRVGKMLAKHIRRLRTRDSGRSRIPNPENRTPEVVTSSVD